MRVKPKKYGSQIINIKCPECGAMFSERSGHQCDDDHSFEPIRYWQAQESLVS